MVPPGQHQIYVKFNGQFYTKTIIVDSVRGMNSHYPSTELPCKPRPFPKEYQEERYDIFGIYEAIRQDEILVFPGASVKDLKKLNSHQRELNDKFIELSGNPLNSINDEKMYPKLSL